MIQDITTYRVSLDENDQPVFEEVLVGAGALCGSTLIDRNVHDWMVEKFGDDYNNVDKEFRSPSSPFFVRFEEAKKGFTGPEHARRIQVAPINMPGVQNAACYNKRNNAVYLQP